MPSDEKVELAYYEAGQALTGCLKGRMPVMVSIKPDEEDMLPGYVLFEDDLFETLALAKQKPDSFSQFLETNVLIILAGPAAVNLYRHTKGLDEIEFFEVADAEEFIEECIAGYVRQSAYHKEAQDRVRHLLVAHWDAVEKMATELLVFGSIYKSEICSLVSPL